MASRREAERTRSRPTRVDSRGRWVRCCRLRSVTEGADIVLDAGPFIALERRQGTTVVRGSFTSVPSAPGERSTPVLPSYGSVICPVSKLVAPCENSTWKTAPEGTWLLGTDALTFVASAAATTTSCVATSLPLSRNTALTV